MAASLQTVAEDDQTTLIFSVIITNVEGNSFNRGDPSVDVQFGGIVDTAGLGQCSLFCLIEKVT